MTGPKSPRQIEKEEKNGKKKWSNEKPLWKRKLALILNSPIIAI